MGQVHVGDLHWAVGACLGAAMCLVTILGHTSCVQDVAVHRELQWCSKLDDDTNSMVVQAPQINPSRRASIAILLESDPWPPTTCTHPCPLSRIGGGASTPLSTPKVASALAAPRGAAQASETAAGAAADRCCLRCAWVGCCRCKGAAPLSSCRAAASQAAAAAAGRGAAASEGAGRIQGAECRQKG